ncbi:N-acetylmuramoyl-L-alanine amidase [Streptococcus mitis]|uniref:N-acetylmuramoyl-L-alanine amidase n=1 Tax=Streptococcus mitis SK1080 TaxID=1008453 RepID=F9HM08_STRMT|nr:N-acetylmuramoyl-L-alanine amidase [Streptococcus mitis]EGP68864.1 N-acetylmuramoyl-L-alanine amidase [Streptococcus mitis SK1080]
MKSYKKFTILALALLGLTSQTVLANDASHPTNNSIASSTISSASASQAATENQPTTPSSSEEETKPTLPTESKLQTGWVKEDGKWTYYSQTGVKFTDTLYEGYLFDKNGYLLENSCYQMANKWYYTNGSGKYLSNQWSQINGKWYAFDQNGVMMANTWKGNYYLKSSGAMADKEWVYDPNYSSWFYLKSGGHYVEQQWIGSYYLKSGGYMAHKEWIYDQDYQAWYYLKEDGVYVTGTYTINGSSHFFKDNGKWVQELPKGFEKGHYSKTIFLDPGHGGRDSGAYYYGIAEKDLNLQVSRKLRKRLEELGYTVLTSRDSDVDVDFVTERSRMVNKTNADFFISIHFNATGNDTTLNLGIQTYSYKEEAGYPSKINQYWHNNPDRMSESNRLASDLHSSLLAETGARDAGLLQATFAVLRETAKPAVLLELGYMDNSEENQRIRSEQYQDKLVEGIIKGIQKYYVGN